jgi:hypothetical protein
MSCRLLLLPNLSDWLISWTVFAGFDVHFRSHIQALEKLELDIVTMNALLGAEDTGTRSTGLFSTQGSSEKP